MKITFKVGGKHVPRIGLIRVGLTVDVDVSVGQSLVDQGLADKYQSKKSIKKEGDKK